mgnify:FL=1|jgi:two-component system sensor histidine kinase ArlS
MPARLRITILFTIMVCTILLVVCGTVYYISRSSRLSFIKTRLVNRASYTNGLLSQAEVFSSDLIHKLDTAVTGLVRSKEIQVYDSMNRKIYSFSDIPGDALLVDSLLLRRAREEGSFYFLQGSKEVIAAHYPASGLTVFSATLDEAGRKYLAQLKTIVWLSLLAGVIISFAGGYFFSGRLLRPVKQIADEVNEISVKSLARRIHTGSARDEWHYLATTLNQLLNRLQESFEVQRRFISNASHELCTPLTSISNQLEVSLLRERSAADYRQTIRSTLQDVTRMSKLTQTLLELAKASDSPGGLEIAPLRIDEILLRLPAEITRMNPSWAVLLDFSNMPADQDALEVFGNEELLLTAVRNIVMNACKYSPDQRALVQLQALDREVVITVVDNGPGIASEEMEHIFLPFYRSRQSGQQSGFGLGLSLANHIIKLHKGYIKVQSVPNQGAAFTIVLPQAVATN